jgi:hypothetical protein
MKFKEIHAFKNIQQCKINIKNKMWQGINIEYFIIILWNQPHDFINHTIHNST